MKSARRLEKIKTVLSRRQDDLTVVLENIHDPHNVSAILRSADAVGVKQVQLVYDSEEFPPIGKKSSASAWKWVGRQKFKTIDEAYSYLRCKGFMIYASSIHPESTSLFSLDLTQKVALVFGNEHRGVSEKAATQADERFVIPMFGMIESLNVSVACAVTLYEALRQRLVAAQFSKSRLGALEFNKLLQEWARK